MSPPKLAKGQLLGPQSEDPSLDSPDSILDQKKKKTDADSLLDSDGDDEWQRPWALGVQSSPDGRGLQRQGSGLVPLSPMGKTNEMTKNAGDFDLSGRQDIANSVKMSPRAEELLLMRGKVENLTLQLSTVRSEAEEKLVGSEWAVSALGTDLEKAKAALAAANKNEARLQREVATLNLECETQETELLAMEAALQTALEHLEDEKERSSSLQAKLNAALAERQVLSRSLSLESGERPWGRPWQPAGTMGGSHGRTTSIGDMILEDGMLPNMGNSPELAAARGAAAAVAAAVVRSLGGGGASPDLRGVKDGTVGAHSRTGSSPLRTVEGGEGAGGRGMDALRLSLASLGDAELMDTVARVGRLSLGGGEGAGEEGKGVEGMEVVESAVDLLMERLYERARWAEEAQLETEALRAQLENAKDEAERLRKQLDKATATGRGDPSTPGIATGLSRRSSAMGALGGTSPKGTPTPSARRASAVATIGAAGAPLQRGHGSPSEIRRLKNLVRMLEDEVEEWKAKEVTAREELAAVKHNAGGDAEEDLAKLKKKCANLEEAVELMHVKLDGAAKKESNHVTEMLRLEEDLDCARARIADLLEFRDKLQSQLKEAKSAVGQLQVDASKAKELGQGAAGEVQKLVEENEYLQRELGQKQVDQKKMQVTLREATSAAVVLRELLTSAEKAVEVQRQRADGLEEAAAALMQEKEEHKASERDHTLATKLGNQLEEAKKELEKAQTDAASAREQVEMANKEIGQLQAELGKTTTEMAGLRKQMQTVQQEARDARGDAEARSVEVDALTAEVAEVRKRLGRSAEVETALAGARDALQGRVGVLEGNLKEALRRVEAAHEALAMKDRELGLARTQVLEMEGAGQPTGSSTEAALAERLARTEAMLDTLQGNAEEFRQLKEEREKLERELQLMAEKLLSAESLAVNRARQVAAAESALGSLRGRLDETRAMERDEASRLVQASGQLDWIKTELAHSKQEADFFHKKTEAAEAAMAQLRTELADAGAQREASDRLVAQLQEQALATEDTARALRAEVAELRGRVERGEEALVRAAETLRAREQELAELKQETEAEIQGKSTLVTALQDKLKDVLSRLEGQREVIAQLRERCVSSGVSMDPSAAASTPRGNPGTPHSGHHPIASPSRTGFGSGDAGKGGGAGGGQVWLPSATKRRLAIWDWRSGEHAGMPPQPNSGRSSQKGAHGLAGGSTDLETESTSSFSGEFAIREGGSGVCDAMLHANGGLAIAPTGGVENLPSGGLESPTVGRKPFGEVN